jgi:hypothetical protein
MRSGDAPVQRLRLGRRRTTAIGARAAAAKAAPPRRGPCAGCSAGAGRASIPGPCAHRRSGTLCEGVRGHRQPDWRRVLSKACRRATLCSLARHRDLHTCPRVLRGEKYAVWTATARVRASSAGGHWPVWTCLVAEEGHQRVAERPASAVMGTPDCAPVTPCWHTRHVPCTRVAWAGPIQRYRRTCSAAACAPACPHPRRRAPGSWRAAPAAPGADAAARTRAGRLLRRASALRGTGGQAGLWTTAGRAPQPAGSAARGPTGGGGAAAAAQA